MGTALTVPKAERNLGIINTNKVDISKAKASLAARGSSVRLFPGDALNYKKGTWYLGFGKKDGPNKRRRVKEGTRFVMNLANAVETWQTFVDGKPKFAPLAYLINGESRPDRKEMGMLDESQWTQGDEDDEGRPGKPMDPVQAITVCPIRAPKGTELHHITLGSISSQIAFEQLLGVWLDQYDDNPGKLPIVELSESDERTVKGSKKTYLVPTFTIVGWETASKLDNPGPGGIEVAQPDDEEPEEDDEAEIAAKARAKARAAKARVAAVEPDEEEDEPTPAPKSKVKAKTRAVEPDDEEEDEEPAHDPRKGNGKSTRRAKTFEEIEEEEAEEARKAKTKSKARAVEPEEDEDDERPVVRSRTKSAPKVEELEEEDEPVRPRKRRPALH